MARLTNQQPPIGRWAEGQWDAAPRHRQEGKAVSAGPRTAKCGVIGPFSNQNCPPATNQREHG
jgi:hypothetical protein